VSAASIDLGEAYRYCRRVNARHGKTFYLATALLPASKRPPVHALYGFARHADDIVDQSNPAGATSSAAGRTAALPIEVAPHVSAAGRLAALRTDVDAALAGAPASHPVVRALADTVHRFGIDRRYIADFLTSMEADLTVTRYPTFADLDRYMWGSASVIGLQLLPILGTTGDREMAERYAGRLGVAFQLTNFIRDVGEDYRRGRIYLPEDSLAEHGVTPEMLSAPRAVPNVRRLVAAEIDRARSFYRLAEPGIGLLSADARDCVRTAFVLYGEILDEIERAGYDVLIRRAVVPRRRRLRVGVGGYLRAVRARGQG